MTRAEELLALYEAIVHRIISYIQGHRATRRICDKGYRKVGDKCRRMTTKEMKNIKSGHKRAARKNKIHQGSIQRKRMRSLMRRFASMGH